MITRAPRPTSNFYLLDKAISEDKRLGWASRGLLIFLLGKPDHWTVSPAALVNETAKSSRRMGRDGVYAVLKELKEVGYLRTIGNRNDGGTFAGADYLVSESPYTAFPDTVDSPHTALPDTVEPDTANPTQVSIDSKQGLKEEKKGLKSASAPPPFIIPDWINKTHWDAWHSCDKRKKASDAQKLLTVLKLDGWRAAGIDHAAALENAAIGGWQGLFKPDDKQPFSRFPEKGAIPPISTVWHESAAGVAQKAAELNLKPQGGTESHPAFKSRVEAAMNRPALSFGELAAMAAKRAAV